jgi:hypothetical protein
LMGLHSGENVSRMTQYYVHRLCCPQVSILKGLDI